MPGWISSSAATMIQLYSLGYKVVSCGKTGLLVAQALTQKLLPSSTNQSQRGLMASVPCKVFC
jgi:hypothetical protein